VRRGGSRWESRDIEENGSVSIIRIGLGENKKYADGWEAIFGGGKSAREEGTKDKPAKKKPAKAAARKPAAKKKTKKK
jgi:hypothetical protein